MRCNEKMASEKTLINHKLKRAVSSESTGSRECVKPEKSSTNNQYFEMYLILDSHCNSNTHTHTNARTNRKILFSFNYNEQFN